MGRHNLTAQGQVELKVFDVAGRLVETLANETRAAGPHSVVWRGTDGHGSPVANGLYFVRMRAAGQTFTMKMTLIK